MSDIEKNAVTWQRSDGDDGERLTVEEAFSLFTLKEGEAIVVILGLDSEYKPTIPSIAVDAACLPRDEGWNAPYRYYDRYYMGRFPVRAVRLDGWKIFIQIEDEDEGDAEAEDVEDTESSPRLVS